MSGPCGELRSSGFGHQTKIFARSLCAVFGYNARVFQTGNGSPIGGVDGFAKIARVGSLTCGANPLLPSARSDDGIAWRQCVEAASARQETNQQSGKAPHAPDREQPGQDVAPDWM